MQVRYVKEGLHIKFTGDVNLITLYLIIFLLPRLIGLKKSKLKYYLGPN